MKKSLLAPLFALAFLVSQAWGGEFCNCGPCTPGSDPYGCEDGGCYWKSGQPGGVCGTYCPEVAVCPAGTLPPQIELEGGYPTGEKEWCRWADSCWPIANGKRDECIAANASVYTKVPSTGESKAANDGKQCEGGTWVAGAPEEGFGYGFCNWGPCIADPSNPYGCIEGGCFEIIDATQDADCTDKIASQAQCPPGSLPGGQAPIISVPKAQGLTVIPNGRSLHILSVRDAKVSVYDLAGNRVLNRKVSSGNSTISLTNQKQGVYYAVVTSGAQTQTVKVLLK